MSFILEVKNLVKKYGTATAVDGISFDVANGTCFGLLGPNGAGKTTTIEIIEGVARASGGEILYNGAPCRKDFQQEVGIQFQHTSLLAFLTVRETLQTFRTFYKDGYDTEELIELCSLGTIADKYTDRISGGQRQRLLLALALVNRPRLVFLDEPSTGLDPHARWDLWQVVKKIKESGNTIILTTHYMEEAQQLCDDIAIMDQGKIIARGTPTALIETHCRNNMVVLPRSAVAGHPVLTNYTCRERGRQIEIDCTDTGACISQLIAAKIDLTHMAVQTPNLETVFLTLTGRKLRQ